MQEELIAKRYGYLISKKEFNKLKTDNILTPNILNFFIAYL